MGNLSHTTGNVGIGNALASTIPGVLTVTDTTNTTKAAFGTNAANSLNFIQGGGDYMAIGYNLRHTGTNNTWNYAGNGNEFASLLRWQQGGFQFWGTSTQGAAPDPASLTNFLSIKNSGNVGIGTDNPTVKLDVNGTLKVGDFGGATNVMVKPSNTTPGAVGYVQPIFFAYSGGGASSRGIPAGTWFVYGQWVENTNDSYDNDPTNFMAKVWTVPTGKYLHIATDDQLWSVTDAGNGGKINLHWKLSDNATESISGAVSTWGTGWNTFVIPPTSNPSATTVGSDAVTAMSNYVYGYAEYDTHGVRGFGNNTTLGPGYGYIQRLS